MGRSSSPHLNCPAPQVSDSVRLARRGCNIATIMSSRMMLRLLIGSHFVTLCGRWPCSVLAKIYWAAAAPCWSWTTELFRCPPPLHHSSAQNRLWRRVQKQQQLICAFRGFIIQSSQHFAKLFSVSIIQTGKKERNKKGGSWCP